eukprot:1224663-Prymnesium_polylepis.2
MAQQRRRQLSDCLAPTLLPTLPLPLLLPKRTTRRREHDVRRPKRRQPLCQCRPQLAIAALLPHVRWQQVAARHSDDDGVAAYILTQGVDARAADIDRIDCADDHGVLAAHFADLALKSYDGLMRRQQRIVQIARVFAQLLAPFAQGPVADLRLQKQPLALLPIACALTLDGECATARPVLRPS